MKITVKQPIGKSGSLVDLIHRGNNWMIVAEDREIPITACDTDMSVLGREHYKVLVTGESSGRVIRYADLHRHSDNSLLDGMTKVSQMVEATEYAGALTDHGVLYGFLEFYKGMMKAGKKPIIGFEAYVEDIDGELNRNHLILLAKNETGFHNLLLLCSEAYEHFNRKPHVTWEMLEKYHEGVIATSACLAGLIPHYLMNGNRSAALQVLDRYQTIFGSDFYLEIQRHHVPEEKTVNREIIQLAKSRNIPLIATTDAHYLRKEDKEAHEVLLCLQTKKTLEDEHMTFPGDGYHIRTSEEMEDLFYDLPEALDATLDLADKVDLTLSLGTTNMPKFDIPEPFRNDAEYFRHLCREGFLRHFGGTEKENDETYLKRYDYEMDIIVSMGFASYFLIVWDYINWAREHGIYVGPGRGSAAGSLLAYCLGITDLDPIRYNLLFERFLNPERVSMPDIDTDFEHSRREEVIQYVRQKYGEDHVSHIVTFGTMAARMAVKDVARVLGYSAGAGTQTAKLIPAEAKMTIDKAMEENPDLKSSYESDCDVQRIIDIAKSVEGGKRHASQHACGILIAPEPIHTWIPTSMEIDKETGEKGLTAQVSMSECEELSILKMDFLGLKNMSVIHEVVDGVVRDFGLDAILKQIGCEGKAEFRYQDIPTTDRDTYRMLSAGLTGGVFQLESPGMTNVIREMFEDIETIPDNQMGQCFERLIAAVALYRPGPMDYIPDYQKGRKDHGSIHYDCIEEESILAPTYGIMVFQEQLMQIAQKLAGYSLGRADLLRKACGKKKKELMDAEHSVFVFGNKSAFEAGKDSVYIPGCIGNGIQESVAEEIWEKMVKFASYAFNRSHAACYAYVAYITAYMACRWPKHFYCAMLNAFIENSDKVRVYLSQAVSRGLKILPPDINRSGNNFTVDCDANGIRFGLKGISGLNKLADSILSCRETDGLFSDMEDFYYRLSDMGEKPGRAQMEKLVFAGAFDSFGHNKNEAFTLSEIIANDYAANAKKALVGQFTLFDTPTAKLTVPHMNELSTEDLLERECESLGIYLTDHPARIVFDRVLKAGKETPIPLAELEDLPSETRCLVIGQIKNLNKRYTKAGDEFYSFELQDQFQKARCIVFPKRAAAAQPFLTDNAVIGVRGSYILDENFGNQIVVDTVLSEESMLPRKPQKLLITVTDRQNQNSLLELLRKNPGDVPVFLKVKNREKIYDPKMMVDASLPLLDLLSRGWAYALS